MPSRARQGSAAKTVAIAEVLSAQQIRRGAPVAARDAAAQLANPETVAVVTGQQAGAFGGPLFTLLKAVTAIQLARRVSARAGRPCGRGVLGRRRGSRLGRGAQRARCSTLSSSRAPITLADPEGAGELPVAALTLDERIEQSLDELLSDSLPAHRFHRHGAVVAARRLPARHRDGGARSPRWIEALLGPHGLVVFESADPAAKPLAAPVFARELQRRDAPSRSPLAAGEQLRGARPRSRRSCRSRTAWRCFI